jgi:hypothetical protein
MSDGPLPTGVNGNGRGPGGRFGEGNRFAKGNPNNRKVQVLRNALLAAVTEDDIAAVMAKLIELAKAGDVHAAKELLDRVLGKSVAAVELTTTEVPTDELTHEERLARLVALLDHHRQRQKEEAELVAAIGQGREVRDTPPPAMLSPPHEVSRDPIPEVQPEELHPPALLPANGSANGQGPAGPRPIRFW